MVDGVLLMMMWDDDVVMLVVAEEECKEELWMKEGLLSNPWEQPELCTEHRYVSARWFILHEALLLCRQII